MDIFNITDILNPEDEDYTSFRLYKPIFSTKYKLQIFRFKWFGGILPKTIMVFNSKQEAIEYLNNQGLEIHKIN